MSGGSYSEREKEKLLYAFVSGDPLSCISKGLGRSPSSVVNALKKLSGEDPGTWDPEKVKGYVSECFHDWYHNRGGKESKAEYYRMRKEEIMNRQKERKDKAAGIRSKYYRKNREKVKASQKEWRVKNNGKWKKFGRYLEGIVKEHGGFKNAFASEMGIHPTLLSHYIAGNRKPKDSFIERISERFGVSQEGLRSMLE